MRSMAGLRRSGRYADEVMSILAKEEMHGAKQEI